jgi:hypothetical protein
MPSPRQTTRNLTVTAAAVLALGGLAACGGGDVPDEAAQEIEQLSEELGTLDDRVTALEENWAGAEPEDLDDIPAGEVTEPFDEVGAEVTVSGPVSELYDTTDAGAAFRVAVESGEEVAVVTQDPPDELLDNDTVQVTGTVVRVDEGTFEDTFGIAVDELLNDADGFFVDADGEMAIDAESVELVESAG